MPISPFPPAPSRADPATFADKADAYLSHLESPFVAEANALQTNVNAKEAAVNASATAAAASALAAANTANVAAWVSGTTYAVGVNRYDTTDFLTYRRKIAGAGTTRPGLDPTNWQLLTGLGDISSLSLAAPTGSALVGFQQPGGVARMAESKLRESVSVKDFGAVGDGVTDDYAAAFAGYNYLISIGGGVLRFPSGAYRLDSTLRILDSRVTLEGDGGNGLGGTVILNGVASGPAIEIGDVGTQRFTASVKKMAFAGASGVAATAGNCGLAVYRMGQCTFDDLQVLRYPQPLYDGLKFEQVAQSYFTHLHVQEAAQNGLVFDRCNDIYLSSIRSDANGVDGIAISDTNGVFAVNVTAYANGRYAWHLFTSGLNNNKNHFYTQCIGDTSGSNNWQITQLQASAFTASWGATQINPAVNTFASGWYLEGDNVDDLQFSGCWALYNNRHGVNLVRCTRIAFRDLISGTQVNGNGRSGAGSGVFVNANCSSVRFLGGRFEYNAEYGASVASAATGILFDGGSVTGNGVGMFAPGSVGGTRIVRNMAGYTPLSGAVTHPDVPASGVTVTNTTGVDCDVSIFTGAVSAIYIDGAFSFNKSDIVFSLRANSTVRIDYTVAPVWKWLGQ